MRASARSCSGPTAGRSNPRGASSAASDVLSTAWGPLRTATGTVVRWDEVRVFPASSDPAVGRYETNANTDAPAGHVVIFAIDRNTLPPGTELLTVERRVYNESTETYQPLATQAAQGGKEAHS